MSLFKTPRKQNKMQLLGCLLIYILLYLLFWITLGIVISTALFDTLTIMQQIRVIVESIALVGSFFGGLVAFWSIYLKFLYLIYPDDKKDLAASNIKMMDIVKEATTKILENMEKGFKEHSSDIAKLNQTQKGPCKKYLRQILDMLVMTLPDKLPGIETGYPELPPGKNSFSKEINDMKWHIEELNQYPSRTDDLASCFDLNHDYLSQRAWFLAGNFWYFVKEYERALEHYQLLQDKEPLIYRNDQESKAFNKVILLLNMGVTLGSLEKLNRAVKVFNRVIEIEPDFYEAWYNKGITLDKQNDYSEAAKAYEKAIEIKPDFYEAWNNKGTALANQGNYSEAAKAYDKATKIKPDLYVVWNNKGAALANQGNYPEAVKAFDKAIEIKPDFHLAWNNKGTTLDKQGNYPEALKSCNIAIEIKPDFYEAWHTKGAVLANQGNYSEAVKAYDKAIEIKPDFY
ncbi:MAG: tetratricopeptide repeat protein, partial [Candidatus Odinarchaeota archaeon]